MPKVYGQVLKKMNLQNLLQKQ